MPVIKSCRVCGNEFRTKPYFLRHGGGKYCSSACQYVGMKTGKVFPCFVCKKEIYRPVRRMKITKSKKFFCSKSCVARWRNEQLTGKKHHNWKTGIHAYRSIISRQGIPKVCRLCKEKDFRILVVHHIDKNRKNNKLGNLAWLCRNCHYLVHHYEAEQEKFMVPMV